MAEVIVYGLHDFIAENPDEVSFSVGERIVVLEKDDEFNDGWWVGRNCKGQEGLFPETYTTPTKPDPSATPVLPRTNGHSPAAPAFAPAITTSPAAAAPPSSGALDDDHAKGGPVMRATMTDIQDAIEQIGSPPPPSSSNGASAPDPRGEPSIRSSRTDLSDLEDEEAEEEEDDEEARERNAKARVLLAQKAQAEAQRAQEREARERERRRESERLSWAKEKEREAKARASVGHAGELVPPPTPHGLEFSDESEGDESEVGGPAQREREASTALESVREHSPPPALEEEPQKEEKEPAPGTAEPESPIDTIPPPPPEPLQSPIALISPPTESLPQTQRAPSPSAAPVPVPIPQPQQTLPLRTPSPSSLSQRTAGSASAPPAGVPDARNWSVEQVVEWGRSKGFDEGVLGKFEEHEISGDVLSELDATTLKEIDVIAFGKRVKIAHAIRELFPPPPPPAGAAFQRAPSVSSTSTTPYTPLSPASATWQHPQGHQYAYDPRASVPVPGVVAPGGAIPFSPESVPSGGELGGGSPVVRSPSGAGVDEQERAALQGLGLREAPATEGSAAEQNVDYQSPRRQRPVSLVLGTADQTNGHRRTNTLGESVPEEPEPEEAGAAHLAAPSSANRSSTSVHASSPVTPSSASAKSSSKKRASDPKGGARESAASFFTGGFGSKGRKPAPRYSGASDLMDSSPDPNNTKKNSISSRLHLGPKRSTRGLSESSAASSAAPSTHRRPSAPNGSSLVDSISVASNLHGYGGGSRRSTLIDSSQFDDGVGTALQKIGVPDYQGWMKKKGERYTSWKMRFFVLKGPQLFYMRNENETKLKGMINLVGYKVVADENTNPGRYGFKLVHDNERAHYFSSEDKLIIRDWMKELMKATIQRDYAAPVVSSCNIPTIPLNQAQAMYPPPRPPSPTSRARVQRATARANPDQLSAQDAKVLMRGMPAPTSPKNSVSHQGGASKGSYEMEPEDGFTAVIPDQLPEAYDDHQR